MSSRIAAQPSRRKGNDPMHLTKLLQEFRGPVFLPYWECHSSDGNPAIRVCLFCPSAYHYSDKTTLNKLTKALELNRVIVCALFAVALITWLRIQTEAVFTDFLSKELAFISIWGENIKGCVTIVIMMIRRRARWNKSYTHLCSCKLQFKQKIPGAQISTGKKSLRQLVWKRLCSQNGKGKIGGPLLPLVRIKSRGTQRLE